MIKGYYNNGNTDEPVLFYHLSQEDVQNANADNYLSYLYDVTQIFTFIKGLYKYTLYEEDWDKTGEGRSIKLENTDWQPLQDYTKVNLFHYFMDQMALAIEAEAKTRDSHNWPEPDKRDMIFASLHDIFMPGYRLWKQQMEEKRR